MKIKETHPVVLLLGREGLIGVKRLNILYTDKTLCL
jgi:hypothetical protein